VPAVSVRVPVAEKFVGPVKLPSVSVKLATFNEVVAPPTVRVPVLLTTTSLNVWVAAVPLIA